MKKFNKQFLREVLKMSDEDIKLVMSCQRKFPTILLNEGNGFCVDGRKLHKELEVSKAYSTWIKTNLENIDAMRNIDYTVSLQGNTQFTQEEIEIMSSQKRSSYGISEEYNLTLECAKEICMVTGLNSKTNEKFRQNSKMCRKYFIKLEQAIKGQQEHIAVRNPEKHGANMLKHIIKEYQMKKGLNNEYMYQREFNMLNENLTGKTALELKYHIGYNDRITREHLDIETNQALAKLQDIDIALWQSGMSFEEREVIIKNTCIAQYQYIKDMYI